MSNRLLLFVLALLFVSSPLWAQESTESELMVGVLRDWPPQYTTDADGEPAGFAVDSIRAIAQRAGFKVRFRSYSTWPELSQALFIGEIDVIPNFGLTESRQKTFLYTSSLETIPVHLFVRSAYKGDRSPSTLLSGRVGIMETNMATDILMGYPESTLSVYSTPAEALFQLLSGQIEALVYPSEQMMYLAEAAGVDDKIETVGLPLAEVKRALAVSRIRPELLARLEPAVLEFQASEEYRTIYSRWHNDPSGYWTVGRVLALSGLVLFLLTLGMIIWHLRRTRRFHRELSAREKMFRTLAESLREGILILSEDGTIEYANPACESLFGRSCETLLGTSVSALAPNRDSEMSLRQAWQPGEMERPNRFEVTLQGPEERPFLALITPSSYGIERSKEAGTLFAIADVTRDREAEKRVRFQARLLDLVGDAVIATDLEGNITFWNQFAEKLYGWSATEMLGRPIFDFTPAERTQAEANMRIGDSKLGRSWNGEFELKHRDGRVFQAAVTNSPILDEDGTLLGVVGVSSDLTERNKLQESLRQAQRLEAVGRLAGGVAHDFNNLLTVISGTVNLLLEDSALTESAREDLLDIEQQVKRGGRLTRQLLAFSRRQVLQPTHMDMCGTVLRMESLLSRLLGEDLLLQTQLCKDPCIVFADPGQVEQVIVNLAVNARDAMPQGGTLGIRVDCVERPSETEGESPSSFVRLSVSDTGGGIAPEIMPHLFEPFFTTKSQDQGTGLGLATVHGIVNQSGGFVEVESQLKHGSEFHVFLPRSQSVESLAPSSSEQVPSKGGQERILLVEDDNSIRSVLCRSLSNLGYQVFDAPDGASALELFEQQGGAVDLVITDLVMPGMSGLELVEKLRKRDPQMAVLLMSGYSEEFLAGRGGEFRNEAFMEKPFDLKVAMRLVREILDRATTRSLSLAEKEMI